MTKQELFDSRDHIGILWRLWFPHPSRGWAPGKPDSGRPHEELLCDRLFKTLPEGGKQSN